MRTFCSPLVCGLGRRSDLLRLRLLCGARGESFGLDQPRLRLGERRRGGGLLLQRGRDRLAGVRHVVRGGRELGAGAGLRRFDRGLLQVVRKDQYRHQHEHPERRRENVERRDGQHFQGLLTADPHLNQSA